MDRLLSMRVFQEVIDAGGFAAAARALDISAGNVTRLVSDLEAHLGVRLIQRTTRRLTLTDAGETYLQRVRAVLSDIEDAESEVSASSSELSGNLRVLTTPILATYFLAPKVALWLQSHPGVSLDVTLDDFPQHRVDEFDVTLMVVEEGYNADVVAHPLLQTEWILCASPAYLKRAGLPKVPADLASHAHLRFPWTDGKASAARPLRLHRADGSGETTDVEVRAALQTRNYDVLHQAALDGAGVATLSRLLATPAMAAGQLVQLLPRWVTGRFTIYVALPSRKQIPARTRAFIEFVRQQAPAQGPLTPSR